MGQIDALPGSVLLEQTTPNAGAINTLYCILFVAITTTFVVGTLSAFGGRLPLEQLSIGLTALSVVLLIYSAAQFCGSLHAVALCLCALALVGLSDNGFLTSAFRLAGFGALIMTVWRLRVDRHLIIRCVVAGLIVASLSLGIQSYFTSFDMLGRAAAGQLHPDTMYHASLAAMLKTYGVTSTGLHGPVSTPYHAFSHMIVAGLSRVSGQGVLEIYGYTTQVLFLPLLILCIGSLAIALARTSNHSAAAFVVVTCLILALTPTVLAPWVVWDSYFVSESYLVSLVLLNCGLACLFKKNLAPLDILVAALLALAITQSKGSVGLIYMGFWSLRTVWLAGWKRRGDLISLALVVPVTIYSLWQSAEANAKLAVVPLHFVRSYSIQGQALGRMIDGLAGTAPTDVGTMALAAVALLSFTVMHFLFAWLVFGWQLAILGFRNTLKSPAAVYGLGAVGAGMLVISIWEVFGGAAYYFSNVALFVAMPVLVCLVVERLRGLSHMPLLANATYGVVLLGFVGVGLATSDDKSQPSPTPIAIAFVEGLIALRSEDPPRIHVPGATQAAANPVGLCWARPFIYPAISEQAWSGVIEPDPQCVFQYYGYALYGIGPENQIVQVPMAAPPDAETVTWTIDFPGQVRP